MDNELRDLISSLTRETQATNGELSLMELVAAVLDRPEIASALSTEDSYNQAQDLIETVAAEASDAEAELVRDESPSGFPTTLPESHAATTFRRYFDTSSANEFFNISYKNSDNQQLNFRFSLLPAIESNLSHNTSASYLGGQGARVPEVKPGLLDRLNMKYVRKTIAGAPPAIQSMGIEQRIWQIVGLFLGNEITNPTAMAAYPPSRGLGAFDVADYFTREVVMSGRPVDVTLLTFRPNEDLPVEIRYRAVIQSCRNMHARSDRTYYAFDLMVTTYYETEAATDAPTIPVEGETPPGWVTNPALDFGQSPPGGQPNPASETEDDFNFSGRPPAPGLAPVAGPPSPIVGPPAPAAPVSQILGTRQPTPRNSFAFGSQPQSPNASSVNRGS